MLNTCLLLHSPWHCFSFSHDPDTPGNRQGSAWETGMGVLGSGWWVTALAKKDKGLGERASAELRIFLRTGL